MMPGFTADSSLVPLTRTYVTTGSPARDSMPLLFPALLPNPNYPAPGSSPHHGLCDPNVCFDKFSHKFWIDVVCAGLATAAGLYTESEKVALMVDLGCASLASSIFEENLRRCIDNGGCVDGICSEDGFCCDEGTTYCGGSCRWCRPGFRLNTSTCACDLDCLEGETDCNGSCTNLASDPENCGSCENACPIKVNVMPNGDCSNARCPIGFSASNCTGPGMCVQNCCCTKCGLGGTCHPRNDGLQSCGGTRDACVPPTFYCIADGVETCCSRKCENGQCQ
jgi:hypothetical protein